MMVGSSPDIGQLLQDLNNATTRLEAINQQSQAAVSKQELKELVDVLQHFNTTTAPGFLEGKKLVPEEISRNIERALKATLLFQSMHPEGNRSAQRNVDQAIASLTSSLTAALNKFDKNLKDLKKYKIGRRVEKISELDKHKQQS